MHNLDDRHCRENLFLYTYVIKAVVTLNISLNIWVGNSMLPWAKHTWKCAISPSVSLGKKPKGAFSYLLLAAGMIVTKVCVRQICLGKFSPLSSDAQVGFSQGGGQELSFSGAPAFTEGNRTNIGLVLQMQLKVSKHCMNAHYFIIVAGKIIHQEMDMI